MKRYDTNSQKFGILILVIFICASYVVSAQDNENEIWKGLEVELELTKDFAIEIEEEMRLRKSGEKIKNNLTSIGFKYELNDFVKLKMAYRYNLYTDKRQHELRPTLYFDYDLDRFEFTYRLRYDKEYRVDKSDRDYLRNRLSIDYNLSGPVNPFVNSEVYYRFNWKKGDRFMKYRLTAGAEIDLGGDSELELFYRYENDFNMDENDIERIFAIYYKYTFEFH